MAVDPYIASAAYWLPTGNGWEHRVFVADGLFRLKEYVNGVLQSESGNIADLRIYEGKKLVEWYPLIGLGDGSERGASP